ncbi:uncharacterized protein LOC117328352 [Pecten maximus]|uniref:uncharacterized protein LOC117328352 n=1 Tax=Pecten maximus TaxID=6579 RepID=UPI001458E0E4|nr:uncharacterized protein LOC117328352 [Pecten maximus]
MWINYTRRVFKPSAHHRLCEEHFSSACFARDPKALVPFGMPSPYCRRVLKKGAVPDVPLCTEAINLPPRPHVRGAFEKRARAEIFSTVICKNDYELEETEGQDEEMSTTQIPATSNMTNTNHVYSQTESTSMCNKKVQVKLLPPQRTRAHQTDTATSPMYRSFGTQTDPKVTKLRVASAISHETPSDKFDREEEDDNQCVSMDTTIHGGVSHVTRLYPWSNLMTASAIISSGSTASKVLQLFNNMNLQMFSLRTCNRLTSLYVVPAIQATWTSAQADLFEQLQGHEVVLGGDARCDSPGYCAKYGTYTLMDLQANKILTTNLVQCNEVASSTHMELEGLKRGLAYVTRHVTVKALVTDRHSMVKKYMREEHSNTKHYFDVWHVAKGISKKLEAMAKKKNGQEIRPWIKAIVNHMHWVSASCDGDGELVSAKWLSLLNHISNKHEGHSEKYAACEHGEITEDREWLKKGMFVVFLQNNILFYYF